MPHKEKQKKRLVAGMSPGFRKKFEEAQREEKKKAEQKARPRDITPKREERIKKFAGFPKIGEEKSTKERFVASKEDIAKLPRTEKGKIEVIGQPVAIGIPVPAAFGKAGTTFALKLASQAKNAKVVAQASRLISKSFSLKTIVAVGGSIAAAAGSMFLGQWAQAEAPEPLSIVMRDVLRQAQSTGDFTLYEEAKAARDEITDLSIWEKILMWTPASVVKGIPNKIDGVVAGGVVLDKLAEDIRIQQETGETDDAKWERIRQEQLDQEKANIDYYNQERKKLLEWEREAEKNQRSEDAAFWRKERAKQRKKEEEDRKAIADFWIAYRKQAQKLRYDARPSNLNLGRL